MKDHILLRISMCALCAIARLAAAQTAAAPNDDELGEIQVVATRSPVALDKIGNSVTVLDAKDIVASQAVVVTDLLAQTPGINYDRNGGVGTVSSVFIRGADSDETVVLIDGVQVNDPSSPAAAFSFGSLLTSNIGRIEILRGSASTLYGSQAIGGVINIVSLQPTNPFEANFSAEGGSYNTGYGNAYLGGSDGALLWRLSGSWYGTGGFPDFDEVFGGKRRDAAQIGVGSGEFRYDFTPQVRFDVRAYYTNTWLDTDGYDTPSGSFGDDNEYETALQFVEYTGLTISSPDGTFSNRLAYTYTDSETRQYDPNSLAYLGTSITQTFYGIGRNIREEYQGTWDLNSRFRAVFGLQHELTTLSTGSPAYAAAYGETPLWADTTTNSGYAQVQAEVLRGLTFTAGERYDHQSEFGGHWTGQLAAAWALNDNNTIVRASFGQGFKSPSPYQLYATGELNSTLLPETATSWDAGVQQFLLERKLELSAAYFHRNTNDLIEFVECLSAAARQCSSPGVQALGGYYQNVASATAHGVEAQAAYTPTAALTLSANYTYTHTENLTPGADYGNELPRRPEQMANAALTYRLPVPLSATIAARYGGQSYDDAGNTIELGGYVVWDLRLSYQLNDRLELYGRVENMTDKHYETAYQYGTAGRGGYLGVRASL